MNYKKVKLAIVVLMIAFTSCKDDEPTIKSTVLTKTGNEISMDGIWESECLDFTQFRLQESFDFAGRNLIIAIHQYEDGTCANAINSETITIEFQVSGEIETTLNGQTVLANKISGTESSSNNNTSEPFKQSFYVDDSVEPMLLYHGVFADDGGATSSDGFPLYLHPFAIAKK